MNLSIGIVGLPNVGKSTLFNALLKKQQALAANYPFATIEPNVGIVPVPDQRLNQLAEITKAEEKMNDLPPLKPATVEFVDIAGLVKGASEGAGLGNKFLSHIREVSVIAHVVRVFEDPDIIKEGAVDPASDYQTIVTELILADLQTLQNQESRIKNQEKIRNLTQRLIAHLNEGNPIRTAVINDEEERAFVNSLFLLSNKPEIIVLNVSEDQYTPEGIKKATEEYKKLLPVIPDQIGDPGLDSRLYPKGTSFAEAARGNDKGNGTDADSNSVVICAKVESDLAGLSDTEQSEYLQSLGLQTSGLERLIQKAYQQLGLISFLTCGEKEVRAWTIKKGINAQNAAGEIHTDFIKHFIRAEVVGYDDFVANNGWKGSREKGKARLEGKEYIVKDGDVVEFKIGQ